MEIFEFIQLPQNSVFFISIIIILIMAFVEVISVLLGVSVSEAIDNLLPDVEVDADIEADISVPVLDWLNFGKVPFLILLIIFLTFFGLSGFIIQGLFSKIFTVLMPGIVAVVIALVPTFILVHFIGRLISKVLPQVETTAVKINTLKGKIAEINIGTATFDNPAEAKVKDRHGKIHYIRVIPGDREENFIQGEKVVLTKLENGIFQAEKVDADLL